MTIGKKCDPDPKILQERKKNDINKATVANHNRKALRTKKGAQWTADPFKSSN